MRARATSAGSRYVNKQQRVHVGADTSVQAFIGAGGEDDSFQMQQMLLFYK
jgi:hypothetical protein